MVSYYCPKKKRRQQTNWTKRNVLFKGGQAFLPRYSVCSVCPYKYQLSDGRNLKCFKLFFAINLSSYFNIVYCKSVFSIFFLIYGWLAKLLKGLVSKETLWSHIGGESGTNQVDYGQIKTWKDIEADVSSVRLSSEWMPSEMKSKFSEEGLRLETSASVQ